MYIVININKYYCLLNKRHFFPIVKRRYVNINIYSDLIAVMSLFFTKLKNLFITSSSHHHKNRLWYVSLKLNFLKFDVLTFKNYLMRFLTDYFCAILRFSSVNKLNN